MGQFSLTDSHRNSLLLTMTHSTEKTAYHIFRVSEVLKLLQLSNLQEVFLKMLIFHYHKNANRILWLTGIVNH